MTLGKSKIIRMGWNWTETFKNYPSK